MSEEAWEEMHSEPELGIYGGSTKGKQCFIHSIFLFWFLVTFGDKVTKIQKYHDIFVYIFLSKMGKTEKKWIENQATKVTKIPKR